MRSLTTKIIVAAACIMTLAACSSIDCPLNHSVCIKMQFAPPVDTLHDTLTIFTPVDISNPEKDTVLINRVVNITSVSVPMSYSRSEDAFVLDITQTDTRLHTLDTIWVTKEDEPHFESVDCSPTFFHTITGVRHTNTVIESVKINYNKVTYDDAQPHLLIYLKERN